MGDGHQWRFADPDALQWLEEAGDAGATSYKVGPMPDKVLILHPLREHVRSEKVGFGLTMPADVRTKLEGMGLTVAGRGTVRDSSTRGRGPHDLDDADEDDPDLRILRWDEYARRRGIPMFGERGADRGIYGNLPGVYFDKYARPPTQGTIGHTASERALFEILTRHSVAGEHTMCTALLGLYLGSGPERTTDGQPNMFNVQRGPLGTAHHELWEECDFVSPPHNLWPDDHAWVLETDLDSWTTAVSGPTSLIAEILASPQLEALRPPIPA